MHVTWLFLSIQQNVIHFRKPMTSITMGEIWFKSAFTFKYYLQIRAQFHVIRVCHTDSIKEDLGISQPHTEENYMAGK